MRLAIVRQRYSAFGGAERFVEAALTALGKTHLEITLLARTWSGALPPEMRVKKFAPFYVGRTLREWGFARAIQAEIAQGNYDLVQSHDRIPGCDIFRAGDGTHRGWLEHRSRGRGRTLNAMFLGPYHRYTLRAEAQLFAHPRLRAVICNSQLIQREIARLYGVDASRLVLIHNSVDQTRFSPPSELERATARATLQLPTDMHTFLFVGSGYERKGLDRLLETLPAHAMLLVVGKDASQGKYQRKAERLGLAQRVRFFGPQSDVMPFYWAADAFVFPAIYEPLGNVVLEAMACGLPVLTSHQCGSEEFIRQGHSGWLVDGFDTDALRIAQEEIVAVLDDAWRRERVSQAAMSAVSALTSEAMVDKLVCLYHSLLA